MSRAIQSAYRADRDWYNRRGITETEVNRFINFINELGESDIDKVYLLFDEYALHGFEL